MRRFSALLLCLLAAPALRAQHLPDQPKPGALVCLAPITNVSTELAQEAVLTQRLVASLKRLKLDVITLESRTTPGKRLTMDSGMGAEARDKNCDYVLLNQIADAYRRLDGAAPNLSLGRRIPNPDVTDNERDRPLNDVQLRYALYRLGRPDPILDETAVSTNSNSTNYNLEEDVDREASRIRRELGKK